MKKLNHPIRIWKQLGRICLIIPVMLITGMQIIATPAVGQEDAAPAIHIIMVADLKDAEIGVNVDFERWDREIERIELNTQTKPLVYKITDRHPKSILDACENLNVGPNDTVIFTYGGHGFNRTNGNDPEPSEGSAEIANAGSKWPELVVYEIIKNFPKRRGLPLWRIYKKLEAKNPRLLLVISDCCNEYTPTLLAAPTYTRGIEIEDYYKTLYLNSSGNYITSASKYGQFAFGNKTRGGFFTERLFKVLAKATTYDRSRPETYQPSWDQVFTEVSSTLIMEDEIKGNQQSQWEKIASNPADQ